MRDEVYMAVQFVTKKLIAANKLPANTIARLAETLTQQLYAKFANHWHPRNPLVGNGYRAVANINGKLDVLFAKAFVEAGVNALDAKRLLPHDFTIWCDPGDVSVRLGHDGSVWALEFEAAPTETLNAPDPRAKLMEGQQGRAPNDISPMSITPMKTTRPAQLHRVNNNHRLGDISNIPWMTRMVAY